PSEFLAEQIRKHRAPPASHSEADATARLEVHSRRSLFARLTHCNPVGLCVFRRLSNSFFGAQSPQRAWMGKRNHVRDQLDGTYIAGRARHQSMVGAGNSRRYRCVVLSLAVSSRPEGRTASRMTSIMRLRSRSVSEA